MKRVAIWDVLRFALFLINIANTWSYASISPVAAKKLRNAIDITKKTPANITAAFEACDLWQDLWNISSELPCEIQGMCLVLQGSCLVRAGRDELAVAQYKKALRLQNYLSDKNLEEATIGRARALQRLMKYGEARDQFLQYTSHESICGAACCSLRLGDYEYALHLLKSYCTTQKADNAEEASAMLGALLLLRDHKSSPEVICSLMEKRAYSSLLYRWILRTAKVQKKIMSTFLQTRFNQHSSFFELAKINVSPYDEAQLIHLDDKVLLHRLLTHNATLTEKFWPQGMLLATEADKVMALRDDETLWICKQRSGYGSHGNAIVTSQQAKMILKSPKEDCLLQRMINPPCLLEERKFSLRIYVVYFGTSGVSKTPTIFISKEGLVKLASIPFDKNVGANDKSFTDPRIHMTNSGREACMIQKSLSHMEKVFDSNTWSFQSLWDDIVEAVRTVIAIYHSEVVERSHENKNGIYPLRFSIPKILGFDFVVDEDRNPWLVEVNRFPGLQPRDESDREIKHKVLKYTWRLASERFGLDKHDIDFIFGDMLELDGVADNSCLWQIL